MAARASRSSARIARLTDQQPDGRLAAITPARSSGRRSHALGAPLPAFWRIDATPLAITEIHAHGGRWTIARLNCTTR
jgi:hypothetical protein